MTGREMVTLEEIEAAAELIRPRIPVTPTIQWPLLNQRCGAEVWVKHENHTRLGAFKVRGGLNYMHRLGQSERDVKGVISATRGNHGQSLAYAAGVNGLHPVIVVPFGNSVEKNAAMKALGAELIEHGRDFQTAAEYAAVVAADRGLHLVPSFHPWLLQGVATYCLEFLTAAPDLDTVYVPIGMGSGICSMILTRDALGLRTKIVGVVAAQAPSYALSFKAGAPVATETSDTLADGVACRTPNGDSVAIISAGADRVITVSEPEIEAAMRHYFTDTHNVAEGAGAVPLAGLLKEGGNGQRVGLVLSGGNVDRDVFARVLAAA